MFPGISGLSANERTSGLPAMATRSSETEVASRCRSIQASHDADPSRAFSSLNIPATAPHHADQCDVARESHTPKPQTPLRSGLRLTLHEKQSYDQG
jgi:hypothetical protein